MLSATRESGDVINHSIIAKGATANIHLSHLIRVRKMYEINDAFSIIRDKDSTKLVINLIFKPHHRQYCILFYRTIDRTPVHSNEGCERQTLS